MNMKFPIGPEFIPDYRDAFSNTLTVPAGQTLTLPSGDLEFDAIHVEGTLRFALDMPTTLRYVNLLVNGGTIWCGDDDTPQTQLVRLIKKDVPLDTMFDPFQWGHGIIGINGAQRIMCGQPKVGWGTMQEANAGDPAMSITLDFDPVGWEVGDELLLPDNQQVQFGRVLPRREARVFIAGIMGRTIALTKGLDFEHLNAYDPDRENFVPPCVANLTRKVNIESENPQGTRGHCVAAGMSAMSMMPSVVNICHVTFRDMGRTRAENIDSTTADSMGNITHVGTNQIARYCDHDHHCMSSPMTSRLACVFINTGNAKWGMVTHQTSDATIQDCVSDGFIGAGFTTEDGNEIRNTFEHNLACYSTGNGLDGNANLTPPNNVPGGEGAGFWFHGPKNYVRNNRACCNVVGFQSFYFHFPGNLMVSAMPGGDSNIPFVPDLEVPLEFSGNVATSNTMAGFESWNQPVGWTATDLTSANNGAFAISLGNSVPGSIKVVGCKLIAQDGNLTGVTSDEAYSVNVELSDGFIAGFYNGVKSAKSMILTNIVMQCVINVDESVDRSRQVLLDRVMHKQLGTHPRQYYIKGWGAIWKAGDPLPPPGHNDGNLTWWPPHNGARTIIKNWQGTGQDFLIYELNQLRATDAWPSTIKVWGLNYACPEAGLTMGQCWDKYGLAYGGGVVSQMEAVPLEGLINGVAKIWDGSVQTGPPRAVMTFPSTTEQLPVGLPELDLYFVLTGTPLTGPYRVQFDNLTPTENLVNSGNIYLNPQGATATGQHVVKTWRLDDMGNVIPGSAMVFNYAVGEMPVPPIDPPPMEVWNAADVGPPFAGDMNLRVRMGVVQQKQM
jgi:hypothetical protein